MAVAPERLQLPSPAAARASVLVPGWRDAPHLVSCLRALAGTTAACPFEVVVSLNEPTEALRDRLARHVGDAAIVTSAANEGFAGACNRAAGRATGELLVFLNDDAVVEPGWLDALVAAADAHGEAAAVGSRVLAPDGSALEEGTVLWSDGSVTLIDRYHRPRPAPPPGARRVDYCSAASLLVRASVFREVGGFDEGYFPAYYEDVDLCLKLQDRGHAVVYEPASVVRHRHGASAPLPYRLFLIERNRARLQRRWGPVLEERCAPAPDDPAALAAAVARAAERRPRPGTGPLVPDREAPPPGAGELDALRRNAEVLEQYAATLESALAHLEHRRARRPLPATGRAAKTLLRDVPGVRPVARWVRRRRGGSRRHPG